MHAHGRAIVAGANLRTPVIGRRSGARLRLARRVALVAECLAWVGADLHRARAVVTIAESRATPRRSACFAPIKDGQANPSTAAPATEMRVGRASIAPRLRDASGGRPAGHRGLVGEVRTREAPRPSSVLRLNEIADCAVEVHAVAAETVVHQAAFGVVHRDRQRSVRRSRCAAPHASLRIRADGTSGSFGVIASTSTSRRRIDSGSCRRYERECGAAWLRGSLRGNPCRSRCDAPRRGLHST